MQRVIREKAKIKIEIAKWPETENGGHVNRVFKNVKIDIGENAGKNLTAAMGQWEWSSAY